MVIPDAHTHLTRYPKNAFAVVNAAALDSWDGVAQLCQKNQQLLPAFGLHPWYLSETVEERVFNRLDELLSLVPHASVGEIGLDRTCKTPLERQMAVFEKQLRIAAKHNCAVSVHCHKCFDILIPIIRRHKLTYVLHGFAGSPDIVRQLSDCDCYFSFGAMPDNRVGKLAAVLPLIPQNRLLVETDGKPDSDFGKTVAQLCQIAAVSPRQLSDHFFAAFRVPKPAQL